jgi:hypothetical protein
MILEKPSCETKNNPDKAGHRASCMVIFGDFHQYACFAVHTRFDHLEWIVADAEQSDSVTGKPLVIRQASSFEAATEGLDYSNQMQS